MKKLYSIFLQIVVFTYALFSQDYHVRIGFVGNSITYGAGLPDPANQSYPAQLKAMLQEKYGDTCIVVNYGISSRTMLKQGDYPFWNDKQFTDCWLFAPEILFICLGTNDTKPQNWDLHGNEYYDDYKSMIDTFRLRNPFTKFIVCYPPPAYDIVWGIRDSVLVHGVMPAIDSIVDYSGAVLVDFYHSLIDSVYLFPDKIHPDIKGSKVMAEIAFKYFTETDIIHQVEGGLTFVSSLTTNKKNLAVGDSAIISWTTINADTAFLNGDTVPVNGSVTVSPQENTVYNLIAKGIKSSDSLKLEQLVYIPQLTKLALSPRSKIINQGDSVVFALSYIDQMNKTMKNVSFEVTWSITSGEGELIVLSDKSAVLKGNKAGKIEVTANFGDISAKSLITVNASNQLTDYFNEGEPKVYFNAERNIITIDFESSKAVAMRVKLFDLKGTLIKEQPLNIFSSGKQLLNVPVDNIPEGLYIYKIEYGKIQYNGKVLITN
jgi:lysophospholipase L1-like esterase